MATQANYASTPRATAAQILTANTARDGSGTLVTVIAGVASGTRVDDVRIQAAGATTAGVVRLFVSFDNGTTNRLLREVLVPAVTPSTTVEAWGVTLSNLALLLPDANALLLAAPHNAETFNVMVTRAGNF